MSLFGESGWSHSGQRGAPRVIRGRGPYTLVWPPKPYLLAMDFKYGYHVMHLTFSLIFELFRLGQKGCSMVPILHFEVPTHI